MENRASNLIENGGDITFGIRAVRSSDVSRQMVSDYGRKGFEKTEASLVAINSSLQASIDSQARNHNETMQLVNEIKLQLDGILERLELAFPHSPETSKHHVKEDVIQTSVSNMFDEIPVQKSEVISDMKSDSQVFDEISVLDVETGDKFVVEVTSDALQMFDKRYTENLEGNFVGASQVFDNISSPKIVLEDNLILEDGVWKMEKRVGEAHEKIQLLSKLNVSNMVLYKKFEWSTLVFYECNHDSHKAMCFGIHRTWCNAKTNATMITGIKVLMSFSRLIFDRGWEFSGGIKDLNISLYETPHIFTPLLKREIYYHQAVVNSRVKLGMVMRKCICRCLQVVGDYHGYYQYVAVFVGFLLAFENDLIVISTLYGTPVSVVNDGRFRLKIFERILLSHELMERDMDGKISLVTEIKNWFENCIIVYNISRIRGAWIISGTLVVGGCISKGYSELPTDHVELIKVLFQQHAILLPRFKGIKVKLKLVLVITNMLNKFKCLDNSSEKLTRLLWKGALSFWNFISLCCHSEDSCLIGTIALHFHGPLIFLDVRRGVKMMNESKAILMLFTYWTYEKAQSYDFASKEWITATSLRHPISVPQDGWSHQDKQIIRVHCFIVKMVTNNLKVVRVDLYTVKVEHLMVILFNSVFAIGLCPYSANCMGQHHKPKKKTIESDLDILPHLLRMYFGGDSFTSSVKPATSLRKTEINNTHLHLTLPSNLNYIKAKISELIQITASLWESFLKRIKMVIWEYIRTCIITALFDIFRKRKKKWNWRSLRTRIISTRGLRDVWIDMYNRGFHHFRVIVFTFIFAGCSCSYFEDYSRQPCKLKQELNAIVDLDSLQQVQGTCLVLLHNSGRAFKIMHFDVDCFQTLLRKFVADVRESLITCLVIFECFRSGFEDYMGHHFKLMEEIGTTGLDFLQQRDTVDTTHLKLLSEIDDIIQIGACFDAYITCYMRTLHSTLNCIKACLSDLRKISVNIKKKMELRILEDKDHLKRGKMSCTYSLMNQVN